MSKTEEKKNLNTVFNDGLLQRIQGLSLMDDEFLSAYFNNNMEDTEFILRIILKKSDLKVKSVQVQRELKNLNGRSVRLDVHATDEDENEMDIEIQ